MQLKRLWDTDGKKIVFTEWPTWHQCQVWTDENGNLYIYDMAQWLAYNWTTPEGKEYDRSNWVALTDQTVWFYDTDKPIELYNRDHWDEAYYQFVDWDWTVLKSWTVEEWQTPTAPADPTREATPQYSYTFNGWNPEVWPIYRRTTYTATYEATLREYEVTVQAEEWGTVDDVHFTFPYWTAVSAEENVLTFGTWEDAVVVTATPDAGYEFVEWTAEEQPEPPRWATRSAKWTKTAVRWTLPSMITWAITFKAVFQAEVPNVAFLAEDGSEDNPLMVLFTDGSDHENFVELLLTTDPETWDSSVEIAPEWIYADSRLEIDWTNVFVSLFENYADYTYYTELAWSWTTGNTGTIISAFFTALKNLFNNPTAENLATAEALLAGYSAADPQTMFVTWTPTPTPTEGYRYIRWNITANSGSIGTQVSEFNLTDWTNTMSRPAGTTVTCDKSTRPDWPAQNLIDWSTSTKFGSEAWTPYAITFDLGDGNAVDPTVYDHYNWYQASDAETETLRNPTSWNVQFSEDGVYWETWSTVTWETIIDENSALAWTWTLTAPTPILPGTYQQVQYIQNTWAEYISTWMGAIYNSTEVEADFEVLTHQSLSETFIYGVWDVDGWFRAWPIDDNWTTSSWFTYDPSTYATNTRTVATGTSETTTSNYAYIFGQGEWASVTHYDTGTMKLYSLVIKENDVVVRNFVPCYIKATNEVWLYDTVTEIFYGNASGSGALVAWPDVN